MAEAAPTTKKASSAGRRVLSGLVVRCSGDKTVVVEVARVRLHRLYNKRQKQTKRYLVHDPDNTAEIGQAVQIRETRPLSARKRWVIVDAPAA